MRREVEVDTQLADLWQVEQAAQQRIDQSLLYLHHATLSTGTDQLPGARWSYRYADRRQFASTDEDREAQARAEDAANVVPMTSRMAVRGTLETLDAQRRIAAQARAQAEPLEAEYRANPWSRFFLVLNTNGHVHSSMHCSTCRATTRFGWQPDLSGLSEADAVAALGPKLCSICFPSAPVEWIGKGRGA